MTNVYRREAISRTVEYVVPVHAPWGACWNEVSLAIHLATKELRERGLCSPDREPADDQIRLHPGDEDIVVAIEVERTATAEAWPGVSQEGGNR